MRGRQCRLWLAGVWGLVVVLQILFAPAAAQALSLPFQGRGDTPSVSPLRPAPQRLQEVPPPDWVQQLQGALEGRDPRVRILSPAPDSLLAEGPWTLRVEVSDWPLVDAGDLGLGPHLMVQLDSQLPIPLVETELEMAPLSAGSHLLTVYAAKPWGEAHKGPYALQQIRLHRLAENSATLPAPGTPQLPPGTPAAHAGDPPLLLDWLLLDAPLQGLRTDSLGWRLRVTLNGESVLLDRQAPLWLKGWQPGSNALLLELLDGRGEVLNPPFNSVLEEVIILDSSGVKRPHSGLLTEQEQAVLLGEQPPSVLHPVPPSDDPVDFPIQERELSLPQELLPQEFPVPETLVQQNEEERPSGQPVSPSSSLEAAPLSPEVAPTSSAPSLLPEHQPESAPPSEPVVVPKPPSDPQDSPLAEAPSSLISPVPQNPIQEPPSSLPILSPPTAPPGAVPAREEVNPDGTLKRPPASSPLARLRQRWSR
ncbi:MAG: hypothetical protein ACO3ZD_09525 [Cyanobium sp.]